MGREFGATTGRPRRCGWFDSVATRHATMVNGIDDLAVTNLDGLDTVETIKVCIGYRDGKQALRLRAERRRGAGASASRFTPSSPAGARRRTRRARGRICRAKARAYLKALAELSGAKLSIVSVGPGREQTIFDE